MTVTLVFKKTNAKIDAVTLDASISERHGQKAEVTRHPVERGANIIDHIRQDPPTLVLEGLITNTPMPEPADPLTQRQQGDVTFQSRSELQPTRAGQAYQDLLDLFTAGRLFTVVTALRTYEDMLLESLDVPRDVTTGQVLRFTATLVQVQTVASAATVNVEPVGRAGVNLGKRAAPNTPDPTRRQSWWYQIGETFAPSLFKGAP